MTDWMSKIQKMGDGLNPVCPICYAVVPEAEFENHVHSCAESGDEGGR